MAGSFGVMSALHLPELKRYIFKNNNNNSNKIFITVFMYLAHRAPVIGDTYYNKINRKKKTTLYVQYHNG